MKKKFTIVGEYTISFETTVIAEDEDEALEIAEYNISEAMSTEYGGNSVFIDESAYDEDVMFDTTISSDGYPRELSVESISDYEEDEEDEDDE